MPTVDFWGVRDAIGQNSQSKIAPLTKYTWPCLFYGNHRELEYAGTTRQNWQWKIPTVMPATVPTTGLALKSVVESQFKSAIRLALKSAPGEIFNPQFSRQFNQQRPAEQPFKQQFLSTRSLRTFLDPRSQTPTSGHISKHTKPAVFSAQSKATGREGLKKIDFQAWLSTGRDYSFDRISRHC